MLIEKDAFFRKLHCPLDVIWFDSKDCHRGTMTPPSQKNMHAMATISCLEKTKTAACRLHSYYTVLFYGVTHSIRILLVVQTYHNAQSAAITLSSNQHQRHSCNQTRHLYQLDDPRVCSHRTLSVPLRWSRHQ